MSLERSFTYQPPRVDQIELYAELRSEALIFAKKMQAFCPDSREKELAIEKLREAIMWANAAIALTAPCKAALHDKS